MLRGLRDTTMIQHDVNMADPGGTGSDRPALRVLKFELQLYKLRDGEYCIDVQVGTRLLQLPSRVCGQPVTSTGRLHGFTEVRQSSLCTS